MVEAGYTHYLWGNYAYNDKPREWYGVYLSRAIYRYTPNRHSVLMPLSSPYGPATLWGKISSSFIFPEYNLKTGLELLLLFKNKDANLVDTSYVADDSLKSLNQWFITLDIPVSYTWRNFSFSITPAVLLTEGKNVFQFNIGVNWTSFGIRYF